MQLSHTHPVRSAVFDDPNLVSSAGLVPMLALARSAGLTKLADQHLSVPTDKGANPGLKVSSLVAGMVAGADSIEDMAVLRHGGMGKVFTSAYAPSTLGSFLRSFILEDRQVQGLAHAQVVRVYDQRSPYVALLSPLGLPSVHLLQPTPHLDGDDALEDTEVIVGVSEVPVSEMDEIVARQERTDRERAVVRGSLRVRLFEHLTVSLDKGKRPSIWRLPEGSW